LIEVLINEVRRATNPSTEEASLGALTQVLVATALADHAGITQRQGRDAFTTVGATDPSVNEVDHLQYVLNEGPCVDAVYHDAVMTSSEIAADQRWPRWGPEAAERGIRSVLSVHLYTSGHSFGALNLYKTSKHCYTTEDLELARVAGAQASVLLAYRLNDLNLIKAVDARHRIGIAQGIIMQRYGVDTTQSFSVLRRLSQHLNRKLSDIANYVVDNRELPPTPGDHQDTQ
jgi:GAF domain-containing protein